MAVEAGLSVYVVGGQGVRLFVSSASLSVLPLATRSHHVVFAYNQIIRPHRSYRATGGLPRESLGPATG